MANPEASVASAARVKAVIERDGRYLLALHNNRRPENKGKWTFVGGLVEPSDPSPEAALLRELQEELQVQGQVLGIVGTFPYRDHACLLLAASFEGEPCPSPEEIIALRWFTRDEVKGIARAHLLHMGFELDALDRASVLQ
jgi:8-oxo-dGTP pyrophosphatase MutT (NUDIX family)